MLFRSLAGDLVERPAAPLDETGEAPILGTGFLRNTLSNREGGADLEEFRVRQVVDRVNTVGTVWLGLTFGCAECHDHKFDPITQRDYFRLFAFFNPLDEVNRDAPLPGQLAPYRATRPGYEEARRQILLPVKAEAETLQARWERRLL